MPDNHDEKLQVLPACPLCASLHTVRTNVFSTRAFYFCLTCGKSFERRIERHKPPPFEPEST